MADDTFQAVNSDAVRFFIAEGVLTFGDFTLKSGRRSPYFFNTGTLCSGRQMAEVGSLYARMLILAEEFATAKVVFGSAYKGIPLAVATGIALAGTDRKEVRTVSDRKEAKTHGDAGSFLGRLMPGDAAVIVDDVITTGGTKTEAIDKLKQAGCETLGLIIAFDRGEPFENGNETARESFERVTGLPVYALASVHDIIKARPDISERLTSHLASFNSEL